MVCHSSSLLRVTIRAPLMRLISPRPRVRDLEPDVALGDFGNAARLVVVAPNTVSRYGVLIHVNNKGRV
jgi:hypothetical protein